MRKLLRGLAPPFVAILLLVIPALPKAFAISDPSTLQINAVYAYRNLKENGDQLYLVEYYNHYAVLPAENVTTAFTVILYAVDGVTPLGSVSPYAYYKLGYDRGFAAIYFTKAQAVAIPVTWNSAYTVKIAGIEPPFGVGLAPESAAHAIDSWSTVTAVADAREALARKVVDSAALLNNSWTLTALQTLTTTSVGGTKLSAYGQSYFENVITSTADGTAFLKTIAPQAYYYLTVAPTNYRIDYQGHNYNVYNTGTATFTKGSATVNGQGTTWTAGMIGREIKPITEDSWWVITGWTNTTTLTIASAYPYATITQGLYIIGTTHEKSLRDALLGTPLDFTLVAAKAGLSVGWFNAILFFVFLGVVDVLLLMWVKSLKGLTFVDSVLCMLAALSGLFPLSGAVAVAAFGILLVLWAMFYKPSPA